MSYGVGWFGRVFGTLGMFGSVVFFVMEVCSVRECFWCGTDHLPEIYPPPLAFLGPPPNPRGAVNGNGKRSANRKKNAYFSFNLLIINDINQYFNIHLHLISFIIYNRLIFIA